MQQNYNHLMKLIKPGQFLGDPTDGALLVAAIKYGLNIPELLKQGADFCTFFPLTQKEN